MNCDEARHLLPALVDGELTVSEARQLDAHLVQCAECRGEHAALAQLRGAVRSQAEYFRAPVELESAILAALPASPAASAARTAPQPTRRPRWNWLGATGAFAAVVAAIWSVALLLMLPSYEDRVADEVTSSHVRALLSQRPADVASSDRHTVKPWFAGKLDFAPPVRDLSADSFPLIGGRLDYIDHQHVAALVYGHKQHVIDVFVWPAARGKPNAAPIATSRQGYRILRWTRDGMTFWAVSDTDADALARLVTLLDAPD
jgi:anti-sigma factor RsiW